MNNKRNGVTMLEMLICLLILSIVTISFSKQVISLINQYTAGKSITKQQLDARNTFSTLLSEIQNIGLKVYNNGALAVAPGITVSSTSPTDSSSFVHNQGTPSDTLTIYKAELDATGNWTNIVDTIRYYICGTSLIREFKATGSTMTSGVLAENVYALQFLYGTNVTNALLFEQSNSPSGSSTPWTIVNSSGTTPTKISMNPIFTFKTGKTKGFLKYGTTVFSVTVNQVYLVNVTIVPSNGFPQNLDSLNFSFRRTSDDAIIGSEKFLPIKTGNQVRFSIKSTESVYAAIDYCSHDSGTINIKNVNATCIETGTYTWMNNPTTATDKQNIKVIRVQMLTRSDNKTGVKTGGTVVVGDATISTSDNYTWRLSDDIIETPSNYSSASNAPSYGMRLTDVGIRSILISAQY